MVIFGKVGKMYPTSHPTNVSPSCLLRTSHLCIEVQKKIECFAYVKYVRMLQEPGP